MGPACDAVGISRAGFYRLIGSEKTAPPTDTTRTGPRSLTPAQQQEVVDQLNSKRFLDCSVREVYATLLDEGVYLCSWRPYGPAQGTMYRLLKQHDEVRDRRDQRRHPAYVKPELAASGPNQVWTWDITYLKTQVRGQFYYLYMVIDIFSRLVCGWMLADRECGELAGDFLERTYRKHKVLPGQLSVHADRGAPMKSATVKQLLSDLGVARSHSRPRVSNDNPFSEAGFKTLKYSPDFPARFASIEEAEAFCRKYFAWYNSEHHHTAIALLTPAQVHYGEAKTVLARRQVTLDAAFAAHPERFGNRRPKAPELPETVWINRTSEQVTMAAA